MTDHRIGNYMHTSTGRKYWPLDPRPEEVEAETIAHHLATRCRYNGAVRHPDVPNRIFYSVAEHSVYVAMMVAQHGGTREEVACALLHDASEAYNGDLIRPLKHDDLFSGPFKTVEERNERAVCTAFDLPYPFPKVVKWADEAVTAAEIQQIVPHCPSELWDMRLHDDSTVAPYEIAMMAPHEAKDYFQNAFLFIEKNYLEGFQKDGYLDTRRALACSGGRRKFEPVRCIA